MKNFKALIVLTALTLSSFAQARSPHPCTPTVKAAPQRISCVKGDVYYTIDIETLMSPAIEMCRGSNYYTYKTANVEVSNWQGDVFATVTINNGSFSYTGDGMGGATFKSEVLSLDLTKCSMPIHGGMSVGN